MVSANIKGPSRSPTVFETCSPLSAKADAHWLMPISLAPAQIIIIIMSQKEMFFIRSPTEDWSSSSTTLFRSSDAAVPAHIQASAAVHEYDSRIGFFMNRLCKDCPEHITMSSRFKHQGFSQIVIMINQILFFP